MPSVTWSCPNCGRRVPNRVPQCHCGTTREDAERQASAGAAVSPAARASRPMGPRLRIGPLSWDLKALLIGLAIVAVLALVRLFWPSPPEPIVPVLGHLNPPPTPSPVATAKGRKP